MDEIVYEALLKYYHALELKGYMADSHTFKLLVLSFYNDFVYNDYRGNITKDDYHLIEKALDCIFGSTCLIPYPDYMKMGKLYLGQITEMAQRVKAVEDTPVLKMAHDITNMEDPHSDIIVVGDDADPSAQ